MNGNDSSSPRKERATGRPDRDPLATQDDPANFLTWLGGRAEPLQVVYHADQVLDEDSVAPIEICLPVAAAFQGTGEVYLNVPGEVADADLLTEVQCPIR
jgi:hypothetical protein